MHERGMLKSHALLEACLRGHTVPGVVWDDNQRTGGGRCMRCGAAFVVWLGVMVHVIRTGRHALESAPVHVSSP
jgi:hypothetical protein